MPIWKVFKNAFLRKKVCENKKIDGFNFEVMF